MTDAYLTLLLLTVIFMSHNFFQLSGNFRVSIQLGTLFYMYSNKTRSSLLVKIKWSVCISNSQWFWESHFLGQILSCAYTICQDSLSSEFLHNSLWVSFTIHSYLLLYIFCVSLLHLLMWSTFYLSLWPILAILQRNINFIFDIIHSCDLTLNCS